MRFLDLCKKEVINQKTCHRLGYVADLDINGSKGCVEGIIVPGYGRFFSCLGKQTEYYIPFCDIVRIGKDIILVDICEECKENCKI